MNPIQHPACNDVLRRPEGMTEEECGDLHIRREDGRVWSFWKPNAEERAALAIGAPVALQVVGVTHPPLAVCVLVPEVTEATDETPERVKTALVALQARYLALVRISKKILAAWVNDESEKTLHALTDQFLDLTMLNRQAGEVVRCLAVEDEKTVESYRQDAAGWKAEADALRARLATETEVRETAEANLRTLHHWLTGTGDGWPLSGIGIEIRKAIEWKLAQNSNPEQP
jgi:hypothetical protein